MQTEANRLSTLNKANKHVSEAVCLVGALLNAATSRSDTIYRREKHHRMNECVNRYKVHIQVELICYHSFTPKLLTDKVFSW